MSIPPGLHDVLMSEILGDMLPPVMLPSFPPWDVRAKELVLNHQHLASFPPHNLSLESVSLLVGPGL